MPAITLARLRQQAALLAGHYDQPAAFVRSLHHLLEFYADRTHRPGQAGKPPPLLDAYHVTPPVLRQILLELTPLAEAEPEKALALGDRLWAEPYLEFRLLAASLLGALPPRFSKPILQRIEAWMKAGAEDQLAKALLGEGTARLRKEAPERLTAQVKTWLNYEDLLTRQMGLRALLPLLSNSDLDHLPAYFDLLAPHVRSIPAGLRPDLLQVLRAAARLSPQETAYFLRQALEMPNNPDTAWIIRQCLPDFPVEVQTGLRAATRASEGQ